MVTRARTWDLRYAVSLDAVGRLGSFSAAAEELGYTQSAVSQHIARLERIVGHPLVIRPGGPKRVSLTPAGEILLAHARAISDRIDSAYADLEALQRGAAGVLRVGCYQSVGARILPGVLREFAAAWPRVRVELTEAEDDAVLLSGVEQGVLDLTFVAYPISAGPFRGEEILEDPYVVVVGEHDPLASGTDDLPLDALDGRPLVTYAQMREVHSIENRLARPQLREQIVFRSNDNGMLLGLAAEGVGAAVISWLSVDPHRPGIRVRRLAGVSPRVVGIAWHRDRYRIPAHRAFIDLARTHALREARLLSGMSAARGQE